MLRRKMYNELINWRSTRGRDCLIIKGARQVGKTYLVEAFGKQEYKSFIEINFLRNPTYKEIFGGDLSGEEIYKRITAHIPTAELIEGETLIFLDEIQKCAAARTAMKFLAEDGRYDVIASGSLLGLHYGRDDDDEVEEVESIPVGYETPMMMYSLDFEEFLWALGYGEEAVQYLRELYERHEAVPAGINDKYQSLLREHIVVGGMPEVVESFAEHANFVMVQQLQEKLLGSYDDDIANHAKGAEKVKVRKCYQSIPRQLARENKKFKYSDVEKKSTSRKYRDSVQWLEDSGMVNIARNTLEPELPLTAYEMDNEFKMYVNDTGLLLAQYGMQTKLAVLNNTLKGHAKGGIYENLISEMLVKKGYNLHYYRKGDSTMEIEFLIEKEGSIIPVEVKAGNTATASMNSFIRKHQPPYTYKLINGNVGVSDSKITLPHYMALFL